MNPDVIQYEKNTSPKKIYLANCLGFCSDNKPRIEELVKQIESLNWKVFEPFEKAASSTLSYIPENIFNGNIQGIDECDILVALLDGNGTSVDDGIAFEMGYAYSLKKPIYAVRSDMRKCEFGLPVNLQLFFAVKTFYNSIDEFISELKNNNL